MFVVFVSWNLGVIVSRAGSRPPPNRDHIDGVVSARGPQITREMLIPGEHCGLIIGKGEETIKYIQGRRSGKRTVGGYMIS
ncbi:hypothetical protein Tcan_06855 [Toxocara canis]|uniref:K Homology domain-containing protein n=1 Tax=Toxocara canis TaxID=6265 RepID=A0A0B2W4R5_TOXCA|nr:hypothetical protein Tcan_06855 [Toxocara canis]